MFYHPLHSAEGSKAYNSHVDMTWHFLDQSVHDMTLS